MGRSLRGTGSYSGVHTIVSTAKKNYLTQWQVVSCSVKLDRVTGILAKSQAPLREALERFEEKSEGGSSATRSSSELPQQDR